MSLLRLEVSGSDECLAAFVQVCKTMEALGAVGASRTIRVPVDGDGSANLRFSYGPTDVSAVAIDTSFDDDEITIGIGG